MRRRDFCTTGLLAAVLTGCSGNDAGMGEPGPRGRQPPTTPPTPSPTTPRPGPSTPSPAADLSPTAAPTPQRFRSAAAQATVAHLAGEIGPREATSLAFRHAADHVGDRLAAVGLRVVRQPVRVPAGTSWGVRVGAGPSSNVVATAPDFDPRSPHLRSPAPGRLPCLRPQEPRGDGDALHHFGSRTYVAGLSAAHRRAALGMVSLDRVGVGPAVRIRTGGRAADTVADGLVAAAGRAGVPITRGTNRASDHWSFEKAGIAAARLGGNAYAAYHSDSDRPAVVSRSALDRTGRLLWEWLRRD